MCSFPYRKMWRLKIAEGGINPYLYSTNNFVGRQIWEFDPGYGSLEERAEVEEARADFWNHRRLVKTSSDVLWRMQVWIPFAYKVVLFLVLNVLLYCKNADICSF